MPVTNALAIAPPSILPNADPSVNCRICGSPPLRTVMAREMMFGTREEFPYSECSGCGTVQIVSIPDQVGRYYPENYYSMRKPGGNALARYLKGKRSLQAVRGGSLLGAILLRFYGMPYFMGWLTIARVGPDDSVLDVGCGSGRLLKDLQKAGFTRLTGIDPFLPPNFESPPGMRILRRELEKLEGEFDLVMLHHCFEHMPQPLETLKHVHRILKPGRMALIRIPVADGLAWREYGVDWVQLDAPRHFHLLTVAGMKILAEKSGFNVTRVIHDSTAFQFWGSEMYKRDIPLRDSRVNGTAARLFTAAQMRSFDERSSELNRKGLGDSAAFYLQKA